MNQLTNALVYLFKSFEEKTCTNFLSFTINEQPFSDSTNPNIDQKYMKQYQQKIALNNSGSIYKYLYDPDLSFDWRFYQRLSRIKYSDRKEPWVTLMFNTGEVRTLTNVLSNTFDQIKTVKSEGVFYEIPVRRVLTPINLVFMSDNIDYLYSFLQALSFYLDRITQYCYTIVLKYSDTEIYKYPLSGMAKNIIQKDLTKLDTEKRGSLVTAGYSFDLIYHVLNLDAQEQGKLLEDIDLQIKFIKGSEYLGISCI